MPPRDPYEPPRAQDEGTPEEPAGSRVLTWAYCASVMVIVVLVFIERYVPHRGTRLLLDLATTNIGFVGFAIAAAWIHASWRAVPESHRGTISPVRAWLTLLVPFYGFYWALEMHLSLCSTFDSITGRRPPAPRALGVAANGLYFVRIVLGAVIGARGIHGGPAVSVATAVGLVDVVAWVIYMFQCDSARFAVQRLARTPRSLPAPRLTPLQREPGPSIATIVVCVVLMTVVGLGCWQILQPGERRPATTSVQAH
jgi:hypothetical protein